MSEGSVSAWLFTCKLYFFSGNLLLNSRYSETNPQLLCAFNADGLKTGFSSVHRSAVEPELISVFFSSSFSFVVSFFPSGDRNITFSNARWKIRHAKK